MSSAGNKARAGLGGQWVGQSFPAPSLFAPRAVQAGLDRAGGSRSQHSRGGLGGQAPGKGMGESVNPSMSRGTLSVPAESCRHAPSFETHRHTGTHRHTHAGTHTQGHAHGRPASPRSRCPMAWGRVPPRLFSPRGTALPALTAQAPGRPALSPAHTRHAFEGHLLLWLEADPAFPSTAPATAAPLRRIPGRVLARAAAGDPGRMWPRGPV